MYQIRPGLVLVWCFWWWSLQLNQSSNFSSLRAVLVYMQNKLMSPFKEIHLASTISFYATRQIECGKRAKKRRILYQSFFFSLKKHKIRHWSICLVWSGEKKKWPKDGAWSIDWSDVLDSLKWSRVHLACDSEMDTSKKKKGCPLSGSWFWERCYPQLEGELWKNLLLLLLLLWEYF